MKAIIGLMLAVLLLFAGVAWAGAGQPESGNKVGVLIQARSAAVPSDAARGPDAALTEEQGILLKMKAQAWILLLAVLKGVTWTVLAITGLYFCIIFLVLFIHITAWFLAQIMGRIVAVAIAIFLVVGCLALL